MDTLFMSSENSKPSNAHFLKFKLIGKLYLRTREKNIDLSNLIITHGKT